MTALLVAAGWALVSMSLALLLGAVIAYRDRVEAPREVAAK
jgi:hypothetical protein